MAEKARHAYGSQANLTAAIESGVVDSYDILLLSGEGENNAMGWITKDGVPIIIDPAAEVAKLEAQVNSKLEAKASTEEVQAVEAKVDAKADAETVAALEAEVANKVDEEAVRTMIEEHSGSAIEIVEF